MKITVIDYGSGNLNSVAKAFEKVALNITSSAQVVISARAQDIQEASHIILPGQGAFDDCMHNLCADDKLYQSLQTAVIQQAKPFFGICVGMQLLAEYGLENRRTKGLNWIGGYVDRLKPCDENLKIPHMGWNNIYCQNQHPVFQNIEGQDVYFVHSWAISHLDPSHILTTTDYGGSFISAIGKDNMVATQFHPEKSQLIGQMIIANFLHWRI